jgi:hypothetical protein
VLIHVITFPSISGHLLGLLHDCCTSAEDYA